VAFVNPNLLTDPAATTFEGGTHSWTDATTNTTLSVVTGQYLSGTYSLRFTAKATGTVQAYSPYVTGVQEGKTYLARIPTRIQAAYAGKVFTARILFYADSGPNIGSFNYSVSPSATSTGWVLGNYPAISAVAPPTATKMRIAFIADNITINDYVNIDDVYLGEAPVIAGNLFGYDVQSVESGIDGWGASGTSPGTVSWGVNPRYDGYRCVGITATVTGTQYLRTNTTVPVTPGVEYVGEGWLFSPNASTADVLIQWYDAGGATLPASYLSRSLTSGTWNYRIVTATAPAGAATARLYFRPVALAVGDAYYLDEAALKPAPNAAGNLLSYDEYSTESTQPAWTCDDATLSRDYYSSTATDGRYVLAIRPTSNTIVNASLDRLIPVTPGTSYQARTTILRHNPNTAESIPITARTRISWFDASGVLLAVDEPDQFATIYDSASYAGILVAETRTAPVGAAFARFGMEIDHSNTAADFYYADKIQFYVSDPLYELSVADEAGYVRLLLNYLPPSSTSTVTIYRVDENGRTAFLRGYGTEYDTAPYTQGPILVEDYEAPLSTRIWYAVEWRNGSTLTARMLTQTVTAPVLSDADYVWFKSPGIPALNTTVMMEAPIKWSREARQALYAIVGRRNPIAITDARQGRKASLSLLVWDEASNALFDALLDTGLTALVQAMPGYGVNGNLYLSIGGVEVESVTNAANIPGWRWTLEVTEVDRPAGGLQGSSAGTWQTVADNNLAWSDVLGGYDEWSTVLTNP
jgi:hypothetical protein